MARVLIVDDDADNRVSLGMVIETWHHEVAEAQDGASAVELAAAFRPDVVILDLGLPGMDGFEVAKVMRRMNGFDAFVIVLSGWTRARDREAAFEAGCSLYLLKPPDLDDLRAALDGAVAIRLEKHG